MTPYAEELVEHVQQYGGKTREQAIEFLNKGASPLWIMSVEQPRMHGVAEIKGNNDA